MLAPTKVSHLDFGDPSRSSPRRAHTVAVVVPTVDEEATIGPICDALVGLRAAGVCDRVVVVDESTDDTAAIAKAAGATVLRQSSLRAELGAVRGKGDAMWRAVAACDEDVIVFVDGDTRDFDADMVRGLIAAVGPGAAAFAKATYRRPWDTGGGVVLPTGGGRVTELAAKPLLRRLFPELAGFGQPLAGEIAARRDLLCQLPFVTGYGVDVALLIDAWRIVGAAGLAEVEARPRQNRHRPLDELAQTADDVVASILDRAGIAALPASLTERPPLAQPARTAASLAVAR